MPLLLPLLLVALTNGRRSRPGQGGFRDTKTIQGACSHENLLVPRIATTTHGLSAAWLPSTAAASGQGSSSATCHGNAQGARERPCDTRSRNQLPLADSKTSLLWKGNQRRPPQALMPTEPILFARNAGWTLFTVL